ncbi:MAG: hypothetical protein J0M00_13190 [Burkholderiales bacterium]|nr:hypothetical protein [Burkholderiales bacterium]
MSAFQFATCDRQFALSFLRQSYPSRVVEDTVENVGPLLDLIASDLIRVQDPNFHQPCQIVPGKRWAADRETEVVALCGSILNNLPRKQP